MGGAKCECQIEVQKRVRTATVPGSRKEIVLRAEQMERARGDFQVRLEETKKKDI